MTSLFDPLTFKRGPAMPNRFMLAPLTNMQSHENGVISQEEARWLEMRAEGGFGSVMTAAAYVQQAGKGFRGQIGVHAGEVQSGLTAAAAAIKAHGATAILQLYHTGVRGDPEITGEPIVGPSFDPMTNARALTTEEVEQTIEAFILAAERAEQAGFDGVELHGAHTYLLCSFISAEMNQRTDRFGGPLENRARPVRDIVDGIRTRCRPDFSLGLRLSAERMGMSMAEVLHLCQELMNEDKLDYIDMSLWDCFKDPEEDEFKGKPLIKWFAELDRGNTRLGVAGNIRSGDVAQACLDAGADFVLIGRAAIAHHDFPKQVRKDPDFVMADLPLSREHLTREGVSQEFLNYLDYQFPGFATPETAVIDA